MAHNNDRSWRERVRREDEGRRYGSGGARQGEYRGGEGSSRGRQENSSWRGGDRGDRRQDRHYGGSMRAGEYGGTDPRRSSSYGGARYGSSGQGGRSGMGYGYGGPHDWGARNQADERGFWDKATDEVSSWFGDEEAERRREMDRGHSGRGPRNCARSDSRINEDVCDRLTEYPMVDASEVEVAVSDREVTLSGTVQTREEKRRAEDIAESVSGVTHVQNNLRVKQTSSSPSVQNTLDLFSRATEGAFGERGGSTMSSRTHSTTSDATSSAAAKSASPASDMSKTTTGGSPGVMRSDPSTSTTRGS